MSFTFACHFQPLLFSQQSQMRTVKHLMFIRESLSLGRPYQCHQAQFRLQGPDQATVMRSEREIDHSINNLSARSLPGRSSSPVTLSSQIRGLPEVIGQPKIHLTNLLNVVQYIKICVIFPPLYITRIIDGSHPFTILCH